MGLPILASVTAILLSFRSSLDGSAPLDAGKRGFRVPIARDHDHEVGKLPLDLCDELDPGRSGMLGVACFDCHVNGHTSAATHLVGDIRPQAHRRRIDTPSLRGVNIQRLFGSQRALKTIEDFTEFEQRAAYFDGDHLSSAAKGMQQTDGPDRLQH